MVLVRLAHAADLPTPGRGAAQPPEEGSAASAAVAAGAVARACRPRAHRFGTACAGTDAPAFGRWSAAQACGRRAACRTRLAAVRSAGAADGARAGCRHPLDRRSCRAGRQASRHGLQGPAQALRPSGAHRPWPPRNQPHCRCPENAHSRLERQFADMDRAALGRFGVARGRRPDARRRGSKPAADRHHRCRRRSCRGSDPGALPRIAASSTFGSRRASRDGDDDLPVEPRGRRDRSSRLGRRHADQESTP